MGYIDYQCQQQDKHIQLPTTNLLLTNMRGFLFFSSSIAFVLGAPQFLSEKNQNENCHTEVVTIFEESEAESVNKVICETEFRDSCVTKLENICNNVATGELECELVDRFNCVDSMTNKCGLESVLKNVSYTETVCDTVMEDICELEVRNGIKEPVEGSCLSKPVEKCGPVTRFTEEFVEEEVCRDIPIKDCENLETESCEVVPHEECKQVVEKVPQKLSKKVTKVVCDDKESMSMETEPEVPDLNDILDIFGVTSGDNEIDSNDAKTTVSTSTTTTRSTTKSTTTTTKSTSTTRTSTSTTTSTTTSPSTTESTTVNEFGSVSTEEASRMDVSKIIFSDEAINSRNKELSNRVYVGRIPTTTVSIPDRRRNQNVNSQIFFPDK